jgi:type I restriction enzyme, S subunit
MAFNQDMKAIVPGPKLRSDFLLYALETFRDNLLKKVGRSGHGIATLMGHEVPAFKIPLPDFICGTRFLPACSPWLRCRR